MSVRICKNFYNPCILQFLCKRNYFSVRLCPYNLFTHSGMNGICKVDCVCSDRKFFHLTFRREHQNFVFQKLVFVALEKSFVRHLAVLHFVKLVKNIKIFYVDGIVVHSLFVKPVRSNAVFRNFVHFLRTNLNFKRSVFAHNGRMQGLIAVRLRHCDIVLEPAFKRLPQTVNNSDEGVAVVFMLADNAQGKQVKQFARLFISLAHFLID